MIGDTNHETNFLYKLLLTYRQDNSSTDIKFSKTQLSKMVQSGRFLWKLLGPLLKT